MKARARRGRLLRFALKALAMAPSSLTELPALLMTGRLTDLRTIGLVQRGQGIDRIGGAGPLRLTDVIFRQRASIALTRRV